GIILSILKFFIMKKHFLFFVLSFFVALCVQAKTWRVNNMIGVTADFTTAQAAHDAASPGDTIQIEPSFTNYGGIHATKRLVWLGIGYFLTENPGNQFSNITGEVGSIEIWSGGEHSIFSGIRSGSISINCAYITVKRCFAAFIGIDKDSAVLIQNYISGVYIYSGFNAFISNNIITNNISMQNNSGSAVIENNVVNASGVGAGDIFNSV